MKKTVVLNIVGLTPKLIDSRMPFLSKWLALGKYLPIQPVIPAVTCSAQACYLTGKWPSQHGIVANGWYFRDECEVKFWRQSNKLVESEKIWDKARAIAPDFTCANLFWWYNMYSSVDIAVTPRPMYPADGRKLPDIYTQPEDLRHKLQKELGTFPLFDFWGPKTSIRSSQWIAKSAKMVEEIYAPTLTLVYIPHLDYNLQRIGPNSKAIAKDLQEVDKVCQDLIEFYQGRDAQVIILSEYGITEVDKPIHINRILREKGYISVREELGLELLDAGASKAFAVADHQIAHIYIRDSHLIPEIHQLLENIPGIDLVLGEAEKTKYHLNHQRSGELVVISEPNNWFTYYYWLDDTKAPDFARTVDIHRKPGYDPAELFIDPKIPFSKAKIAATLLKKKLGFRTLLDVIPLDSHLVKGSHGCLPISIEESPLLATQQREFLTQSSLQAVDVYDVIWQHLFN